MARTSEARGRDRADAGEVERRTPLAATIGLLVGFMVLAVVGVVTVVVPEITDDADDEAGETASDARPASDEAPEPSSGAAAR